MQYVSKGELQYPPLMR